MTSADVLQSGAPPPAAPGAPRLAARWWLKGFNFPHIITALYVAVCAPLIFTHALWIDEAQAFVIARDSHSIGELLWNLRYEGHPPLWHFLLWILTRFSTSILVMQALHLALAATTVYIVARFSPFPLLAKILFPFGYFQLFEYGIISRNYQLVMLLTMAFCALWQRRRDSYAWLGLILALLCLSHVIGDIIAAGLGVMLLCDAVLTTTGRDALRKRPLIFIVGIAIAMLGACASVALLIPPPDYGYARHDYGNIIDNNGQREVIIEDHDFDARWNYQRAMLAASSLSDGLMPIPKHQVHFWDSQLAWNLGAPGSAMFDGEAASAAAMQGITLAVIALIFISGSWRACVFYLIAILGQVAFSYLKFQGGVRHHGGLFVSLLAACWIAWSLRDAAVAGAAGTADRIFQRAFIVLLAVQVYSASVAVYFAWQVPFSSGRAAAVAIQHAMQPGDLLVSDMEFVTPTLAAYLPGHTFYNVSTHRYGNFILWLKGRPDSRPGGFPEALEFAREHHAPMIWITRAGMGHATGNATLLGEFTGGGDSIDNAHAIMGMETYAVYRVVP